MIVVRVPAGIPLRANLPVLSVVVLICSIDCPLPSTTTVVPAQSSASRPGKDTWPIIITTLGPAGVGVTVGVPADGVPVTVMTTVTPGVTVGGVPVTVGVAVDGVPVTVGVPADGVPVTVMTTVTPGVTVGGVPVTVGVAVDGVPVTVGVAVEGISVTVITTVTPGVTVDEGLVVGVVVGGGVGQK